jgi:hypothetical protein
MTLKWRISASGSCPAGVCPGGAEVVRRMASHNFIGSHEEIQIKVKIQSLGAHGCTNDQQIQASLAIRTIITKDPDAVRHQARAHSCNAADASRRYDRRDHDGHGMAAAFGARLSCRCGSQETRFKSCFRTNRQRPGLPYQGKRFFVRCHESNEAGGLMAMRKKRRNGRVPTETSVEDEIVHLRGLDLKGLRARWRSVLQGLAPGHLPRHLLFAIIAYRIQADRFGDLDHETRQLLDRTGAKESGTAVSARLVSFDQKRTALTPGTVLVREWDRQSQRVMVMSDGFAWNGQTYDSLSKVAFAITGTNWNGPRFFGLRDKEDRSATEARS